MPLAFWAGLRRATVVFYLEVTKVFNTVLHNFLVSNIGSYGLQGWITRWVKNSWTLGIGATWLIVVLCLEASSS